MACKERAAKVGGGVLGRVWALVAALALLLGLAAFAPAPAQAASFKDVPSGQWYTSWVDQASDRGLMSGFTDPATGRPTGYFGPDEPLTRAQVATVLWRMAGGPSSGHASFPDVERGSWYDAPVAWCVKAGVVTGYTSGPDKGHFRPDRPVTRQELATMVYRYAKYAGMDVADPDPTAFRSTTDWRTVDSWASEALTWTAAAGVLSGVDNHDGTYSVVPFGTATRAMAAKVFVVLSGSPSAAKASYTVTFNSNGGSAVKAQTVRSGAKASKPADPAKEGYEFAGWYSNKSLTKAFNFNSAVKSNLTLYAKWEKKSRPYAILYKDGLLSLQAGADTDPSHGEVLGKWAWDGSSRPWYGKRARVRSVVARDRVVVASSGMFGYLENCRSMDLSRLDVSGASDLSWMFSGCSSLTSLDISGWDVSNASGLSSVFSGCSRLQSLDLSGWDVSNASDLSCMFYGCSRLRSLDLSGWDVSSATDLNQMFSGCSSLTSLDVSGWDVSNASSLSGVFSGCSSLTSLGVSGWDVSNASSLSGMFDGCLSLTSLDLSGWDVSTATDLNQMFDGCSSLTSLDVSGWDVSNATDLSGMFRGCSSLASLDVSGWDVSNVKWFCSYYSGHYGMFEGCSALESLDVSGWDVSNASRLSDMFWGCSSLASLDLSGWDVSGASDLSGMFGNCSSLGTVTLGAGCGPLVGELPYGPWYDAGGKEYDRPPAGVAGTFTKTKPASLAVAADGVLDADASLPAQIVEGEQDGLRYVIVPEGAAFEYGIEYPELAGRYVGPGVYLTGYAGESDSLVVPLEVAGVPVASANLSWNDSDRVGMTRLVAVSFERIEGKASSLAQLDVSGNGLSSLDIGGLDALVRLNCEGNPIADLVALQAWAAQDGHEAKLPQVQDAAPAEPGDAAVPSEPSAPEQPSEPDVPSVEPGEPSEPGVPAEPEAPSEPAESEVPGEPEAPATPEAPSESEEPSVEPMPAEDPSDDPAASDEGDPASDSLALGEDLAFALAA